MKIDPERLSRLRKKNGLSRPQLAKRSGITERTIQRLESKSESQQHQKTHEHTVNKLAEALGVRAGVLTGELPFRESGKELAYEIELGTEEEFHTQAFVAAVKSGEIVQRAKQNRPRQIELIERELEPLYS